MVMMMMMTKMQIHFLVRVRQPTHRLRAFTKWRKKLALKRDKNIKLLFSCFVWVPSGFAKKFTPILFWEMSQPKQTSINLQGHVTGSRWKHGRQDEEEGNCLNDREVLSRPGFTKELAPWRFFLPPDSIRLGGMWMWTKGFCFLMKGCYSTGGAGSFFFGQKSRVFFKDKKMLGRAIGMSGSRKDVFVSLSCLKFLVHKFECGCPKVSRCPWKYTASWTFFRLIIQDDRDELGLTWNLPDTFYLTVPLA